jgi:hypothetical protein
MSFAAARSSSGAGRGGRRSRRTANLLTRVADQKLIDSWDATRLGETYDERKWRLDDPPDNVSDAWMRLHAGGLAPSVNFASPGRNAAGGRHGDSLLTPAARAVGYTHSAPIGTGLNYVVEVVTKWQVERNLKKEPHSNDRSNKQFAVESITVPGDFASRVIK